MEDTIPSIVDGGAGCDDHVAMGDGDEFEDDPLVGDDELTRFERSLFAAIRESNRLDTEIDDELGRLVDGTYDEPAVTEPGVDDGREP